MLHGVAEGDVRAIHRMRVATRRLRELLPVVPASGDGPAKLRRRLRDVTQHLGLLRELDVTFQLIDELARAHPDLRAAFEAIRSGVEQDRAAARRSVAGRRATLERARIARRLAELAERVAGHAPNVRGAAARRWTWAVQARVVDRTERLKRATKAAGAVYLPERLHDVRIALKKLRYALELLVELGGAPAEDLDLLKDKQDVLGRMHDLQILMARARRLQASREASPSLIGELDTVIDALEDECRRLHARYVGDRAAIEGLAARLGARRRDAQHRPERALRRASG